MLARAGLDVWPGIGVRYSACAAYLQRPMVAAGSIQEAAKGNTTKRDLTSSTIAHPLSCWPVLDGCRGARGETGRFRQGRATASGLALRSIRLQTPPRPAANSRPRLGTCQGQHETPSPAYQWLYRLYVSLCPESLPTLEDGPWQLHHASKALAPSSMLAPGWLRPCVHPCSGPGPLPICISQSACHSGPCLTSCSLCPAVSDVASRLVDLEFSFLFWTSCLGGLCSDAVHSPILLSPPHTQRLAKRSGT